MTNSRRVVVALMLLGFLVLAGPHSPAAAAEIRFSLAPGQSVTLGQYTLVFTGVAEGRAAYDLYVGATLAARFPSPTSSPHRAEYWFGNGAIHIATSGMAPDGATATGTFTVR